MILKDRVKVSTATTGTGIITLGSAYAGYQDFSALGTGSIQTFYTITSNSDWETGIGTYSSSSNTLSRDTILDSSSGGSAISLGGAATVFISYPASKALYLADGAPSSGQFLASYGDGSGTYAVSLGNMAYQNSGNVNITGGTISGVNLASDNIVNYLNYNIQASPPSWEEGRVFYDSGSHTLAYYNEASDVTVNLGQEQLIRVKNPNDYTVLNGQAVILSGVVGQTPAVALALATSDFQADSIGIATMDIPKNQFGYITTHGIVNGIDTSTSRIPGVTDGSIIYLSATNSGEYTITQPASPYYAVKMGQVIYSHAVNGKIFANPLQHYVEMNDFAGTGTIPTGYLPTIPISKGGTNLSTAPTNGQLLIGSGDSYILNTLSSNTGILITNGSGTITIHNTGVNTFNSRNGNVTLNSGDVTTALGFTPYDSINPSGYISGITSGNVTTALGYTPYNNTNPSGYITNNNVLFSTGSYANPSWLTSINSNIISGTISTGNLPTIPISKGGTNLTATPTNGQLLIGNGGGYTLSTLTVGTGMYITNAAGSITIGSSGITANSLFINSGIAFTASGFNGSSAVTIGLSTVSQGSTGTFLKVGYDTYGRLNSNTAVTSGDITTVLGYAPFNNTGVLPTVPIGKGGTNLTATPTNGQLLIGNGNGYTLATLSLGTGLYITNGSGSITIGSSGIAANSLFFNSGIAFTSSGYNGSSAVTVGLSTVSQGSTGTFLKIGYDGYGRITSNTAVTSGDITTTLGFTPYNSTNPNSYISSINSGNVTTALGYTPYNSTNPSGYISGITSGNVTTALGYTPYNNTNPSGYISGITSGNVTTALGYTPYNNTNPSGFISGITSTNVTNALGYTPYNNTNPSGYITNSNVVFTTGTYANPSWITSINASIISGTISTGNIPTTPISKGGTNLTSTPTNGQLLIGNGAGYTLATISVGTGLYVTNGAGSITIGSSGITANALTFTSGIASTVSTFNGSSAVTIGLTAISQGSTGTFLKIGYNTYGNVNSNTPVTSGDITSTLGYTPYNNTNPSGFVTSSAVSAKVNGSGNTNYIPVWNSNTGIATSSGITSQTYLGGITSVTGIFSGSGISIMDTTVVGGALNVTASGLSVSMGNLNLNSPVQYGYPVSGSVLGYSANISAGMISSMQGYNSNPSMTGYLSRVKIGGYEASGDFNYVTTSPSRIDMGSVFHSYGSSSNAACYNIFPANNIEIGTATSNARTNTLYGGQVNIGSASGFRSVVIGGNSKIASAYTSGTPDSSSNGGNVDIAVASGSPATGGLVNIGNAIGGSGGTISMGCGDGGGGTITLASGSVAYPGNIYIGGIIRPMTSATKALIIRAAPSMSANLLEVQSSSGTILCSIDSNGNIDGGTY